MLQTLLGIAFGNTDETFDNETNTIDREQLQVFVFVLAKGITYLCSCEEMYLCSCGEL